MNARTNTQTQTNNTPKTSRTVREQPTPEQVENLAQQLLELKELEEGFKQLQTELRQESETSPAAKRAEFQVTNLRKQILQTQPKLRGSTTTHVGSPRLGAFTRKPRDPNDIRRTKSNNPPRSIAPITTFVQKPRTGRLPPTMGSPSKRNIKQQAVRGGSPAINDRTVSGFRVGKSGAPIDIQARLKKKSPWFSSIMDPLANGAVKIPDPVGTDTGTYQHVENVSVPVNHNGVSGLRVVCPYINSNTGGSSTTCCNYQVTNDNPTPNGSSVTNLQWSDGNNLHNMISFARIPDMMKAVAQSHRVVSAWVVAQPEVSTLNDAGEMCAFVTPFSCNTADISYPSMQSQWDTSLLPVNQHKPLVARWYPLSSDFELFNGHILVPNGEAGPSTISYQDFLDPNPPNLDDGVVPWEFGVVCTGMTPSTGIVRYQIVVNYEYIPKTSTGSISGATADRNDITESNLVSSWVSDCAVTGVVPQSTVSRPPSATTVPDEPSGFGMMFNVIEEMLPMMGKAAALLL